MVSMAVRAVGPTVSCGRCRLREPYGIESNDNMDAGWWPEVDPEFLRVPEVAEISSDPHAIALHLSTVESLWQRRHRRALASPPAMDDDGLRTLELDRSEAVVRYQALVDHPETVASVRSRALVWLVVLGDFSRVEQLAELIRTGTRGEPWSTLGFVKYLHDPHRQDALRHPSLLTAMHAASEIPGDDGRHVCSELRHLGVPLSEGAIAANNPHIPSDMFGTSFLLDQLDPQLVEDLLSLRMIDPEDVQALQRSEVGAYYPNHDLEAFAFEELGLRMSYYPKDDTFPSIHSRLLEHHSARFSHRARALLPVSHPYQFHTPRAPDQGQTDSYTCCFAFVTGGLLCRVRLDVWRNYWEGTRLMGFLNQVLAKLEEPQRFIFLRDGWQTLCADYFGELESFRELVARHPALFHTRPADVKEYTLGP